MLQIWDTHAQKKIYDIKIHDVRIGCLAWNGETICSGSRDRLIIYRDIRDIQKSERKLNAHRQEVVDLGFFETNLIFRFAGLNGHRTKVGFCFVLNVSTLIYRISGIWWERQPIVGLESKEK